MIKLIHGDCLEEMKNIRGGSVDMVLADIPYGTTRNKWDEVIPFDPMWEQICRVAKGNAAIVLFGSGMFTAKCILSAPKGMYRYNLVWRKTQPTGFLNAKKMPLRAHEDIMVFYNNLPVYNPQKTHGHKRKVSTAEHKRNCKMSEDYGSFKPHSYDSTERYPTSVITFKSDKQKSSLHPTQKPVALLEYLIKTYTNEDETVLDFTMGSGSTGVACMNTWRDFIGIELDDKYFDIARRRMEEIL